MFDATLGRFLSRDPAGSWSDAINDGNAYCYVGGNPADWADPSGLGQQVVVGAIKYGKDTKDPGDKDIQDEYKDADKIRQTEKENVTLDCLSYNAKDFYDCLKKKYDSCRQKNKGKPEADVQKACCIEKLVHLGHATAGLGGREGFDKLKAEQVNELKKMMCKGATIFVGGCKALHNQGDYAAHLGLAMLLTESGGTYEGYPGLVGGVWPWETPQGDKNKNKKSPITIQPGQTEAQVQGQMEKIRKDYEGK
jgi:hypothetical protein